jgi:hypothetical protein
MKYCIAAGASLAVAVLIGTAPAADDVKSGLQVGESLPGPFNPLNVTGSDAGKKRCLV